MATIWAMAEKSPKAKSPYVLAVWDWGSGHLRLLMIAQDAFGAIVPLSEATTNVHQAYRWASRQAARQWRERQRKRMDIGPAWEVLDLRQVHAPYAW